VLPEKRGQDSSLPRQAYTSVMNDCCRSYPEGEASFARGEVERHPVELEIGIANEQGNRC
jgi:hypothetical protein